MTVSGLQLGISLLVGGATGFMASLFFIIGLLLVIWSSGIFLSSDSTQAVLQESRSRRAPHSYNLHRSLPKQLQKRENNERLAAVAIGLFFLMLFIIFPPSLSLFLVALGLVAASAAYVWVRRDAVLLVILQVAFYLMLVLWALQGWLASQGVESMIALTVESQAVLATATIIGTVFFLLYPIAHRRDREERRCIAVQFIVAVAGYLTSLYVLFYPNAQIQWVEWSLAFALVLSLLGMVSWKLSGRTSYAKYYLSTSLVLVMFFSLLLQSAVHIGLFWLAVTVLLTMIGFAIHSFTARLAGLATGMVFLAFYLGILAPQLADPDTTVLAIGIGGIASAFLLYIQNWYRDMPAARQERQKLPYLSSVYSLAVVAIIISTLLYLPASGRVVGALGAVSMGSIAYLAYVRKQKAAYFLGVACIVIYLLKLLGI